MMERVRLNSNVVFGSHAAKEVFPALAAKGYATVAWIVDGNLSALPYLREIFEAAAAAGLKTSLIYAARADREPDYEYLDEVAARFRPLQIDALIGIGGGTACDIAKAVGILMNNAGKGVEYRGMDLVWNAGVPVIMRYKPGNRPASTSSSN